MANLLILHESAMPKRNREILEARVDIYIKYTAQSQHNICNSGSNIATKHSDMELATV
jgi:hypothetical protein